uniref:Calmodulin-binding transcription activator 5 n=1 Tax=Rhizophora mucronata TaxID=61149 RepID=A0A2P2LW59_RHIMU
MRLHEINTLEWDELVTNDPSSLIAVKGGNQIGVNCAISA